MASNNELSFDNTLSVTEANNSLRIPVIRRKTNTKINKTKVSNTGTQSTLSSEVVVNDLMLDLSYQRYPNEDKVNKIVKDFDRDALGVIICSAREDGSIVILDGGHRVAAMRMMGLEHTFVDCLVYFGLSVAEEANLFNLINDNRTKPKTQDLFKAKVVAEDADSVAIAKIIEKHGLFVSNKPTNNGFRAIGTISKLFKKNGKANIDATIGVLKNAFGTHSSSFSDVAIMSVSNMIAIYPNLDKNRLIATLSLYKTVSNWTSVGAVFSAQISAKDRSIGMSVVAIREYNKKLRANRLDEKILW